jgi:hypothetical protein
MLTTPFRRLTPNTKLTADFSPDYIPLTNSLTENQKCIRFPGEERCETVIWWEHSCLSF